MNTTEAGAVIGENDQVLHWHLPPNRNIVALPDSRALWDVFWENRHTMVGQAHSHPGFGWPGPSWEDITTYEPLEAALGRRYKWWIASMDRLVLVQWVGPGRCAYAVTRLDDEPSWVEELRRLSREPV